MLGLYAILLLAIACERQALCTQGEYKVWAIIVWFCSGLHMEMACFLHSERECAH